MPPGGDAQGVAAAVDGAEVPNGPEAIAMNMNARRQQANNRQPGFFARMQ